MIAVSWNLSWEEKDTSTSLMKDIADAYPHIAQPHPGYVLDPCSFEKPRNAVLGGHFGPWQPILE